MAAWGASAARTGRGDIERPGKQPERALELVDIEAASVVPDSTTYTPCVARVKGKTL